jgi:hypothetical protein
VEAWFVLVPVALTSAALALAQGRRRPQAGRALRAAAGQALEAVGLTVLFFLANVAAGALVTVLARTLQLRFISIYLTTDVTLLVLSLLQALVYQRWREGAPARRP